MPIQLVTAEAWPGSKPELSVYNALLTLGFQPNMDFIYQSPQAGGRMEFGGAVLDFFFPSLGLAINVQSTYYHYVTQAAMIRDELAQAMMEGWGVRVMFINENDALRDPVYYVKEALVGRDYSKYGH